jgi:hypothetical protein
MYAKKSLWCEATNIRFARPSAIIRVRDSAQETHMAAKFQNFVFEVFDLELDAQYGEGCGSNRVHTKSHNYRSPNRIAVERIGHTRHWRA